MAPTPILQLDNIYKTFGDTFGIKDVTLSVTAGELVCLLGPSGCGKTTLLRIIAGLEAMDSGTISFAGEDLNGAPPHLRGFGLMFQDLALFPHMDVAGNIGFGLRMQGMSRDRVRMRVDEMLELVDLGNYRSRKIHELSGGERQRVALARSLAPAPKLLMLDEPLGSLDRVLRESLQTQVRSILKEVGVTAIYVTHDKDEAFALADTIVFIDSGSIVQSGPPETLFRAPKTEMVARSLGLRNILNGTLLRSTESTSLESSIGPLVAGVCTDEEMSVGDEILIIVDERAISVSPVGTDSEQNDNCLSGILTARKFRGGESEVHVTIGESQLVSFVGPVDSLSTVEVGEKVSVIIPRRAITLVPTS